MSDEIRLYRQELRWVLEQIAQSLHGVPTSRLHWRPTVTANSAAALVRHVVGATQVYVLGFGCGQQVARDRQAEFADEDHDQPAVLAALEQLLDELDEALWTVTTATLGRRLRPPQELWGAVTAARELSGREALLIAIRHAALHLGELRLIRDLAAQADRTEAHTATNP
jgi:uncharacterized damage-inducible protein DinB